MSIKGMMQTVLVTELKQIQPDISDAALKYIVDNFFQIWDVREILAEQNEELKQWCLTVAEVDKIRADAVRDFTEWAFDTCPNIDCMFNDKDDYIAALIRGVE